MTLKTIRPHIRKTAAAVALALSLPCVAQEDTAGLSSQVDVYDVLGKVSKHFEVTRTDTMVKQPGRIYLTVLPVVAYSLQTGIVGGIGGNMAFYTSKGEKANISNTSYMAVYSAQKQIAAVVQPNIWLKDNLYNITGEIVYLKFPQEGYGLGGRTTFSDATRIDYSHFRFYGTFLRQIVPDFFGGVGYNLDYHWDITETPRKDGEPSDFLKYGLTSKSYASGLTFNLLFDNRRNSINPQKGVYANIVYRPNFAHLGSDQHWESVVIDARKYFRFPARSKNVLALWSYNWFTFWGNAPYLDLPSTTWDDAASTGRGYIQGRYRGRNMVYQEAEYRFGITRNGLLGGVVFVNGQAFTEWPSNRYETYNPGYGAGIRIKMNKYSNTNLCLDYGWGVGGSQGLFVNLCEMF